MRKNVNRFDMEMFKNYIFDIAFTFLYDFIK